MGIYGRGLGLGSLLDPLEPLKPEQPASGHNQSPVTAHAAAGGIVKRQDTRLGADCGPSAARIFHVEVESHFDRTLLPIISEFLQSAASFQNDQNMRGLINFAAQMKGQLEAPGLCPPTGVFGPKGQLEAWLCTG